jgi:hypothetical protein
MKHPETHCDCPSSAGVKRSSCTQSPEDAHGTNPVSDDRRGAANQNRLLLLMYRQHSRRNFFESSVV